MMSRFSFFLTFHANPSEVKSVEKNFSWLKHGIHKKMRMDILFMFRAVSIYERLLNALSTEIITGMFKNGY